VSRQSILSYCFLKKNNLNRKLARRLLIVNAEKKSGPIHLIGKGIENFSESLKRNENF
tara:strand:+ start:46 stop:219 length:174 start_codon:yes stop_codon:yes gene_type:complete